MIEILVVVSILAVLMGLVSLLVIRGQAQGQKFQTDTLIKTFLPTAISRYKDDISNRYPPMTMKELGKVRRWKGLSISQNITNECNECLVVALRHPDLSAPIGDDLPTQEPYGNTDEDIWNTIPDGSSASEANEIIDSWGNPIIYIHKDHYKQPVRIMLANEEEIDVYAARKADGSFYNPASFQLISLGENKKQDADEGVYGSPDLVDDILNFKLER